MWPGHLCAALAEISTRQHAEACVKSLAERVDDTGECDFADLPLGSCFWSLRGAPSGLRLDVWDSEPRDQIWPLRSSIRTGLSHLLAGAGISDPAPSRVPELRARCARLSDMRLAVAAAAYQRALVLTCSWHCERQLTKLLEVKEQSSRHVKVLLSLLRGIHGELVPTAGSL